MSSSIDTSLLASAALFSDLDEAELRVLATRMKPHEFSSGEALFREGESGREMYVIASGSVSITVSVAEGDPVEVASVGPGQFIGEMCLLENAGRSATGTAKNACRVLSLDAESFSILEADHPRLSAKVMHRMLATTTDRLKNTGSFLSDMVTWGEAARKRAVTDSATGFYNRRFFDNALVSALERAEGGEGFILASVDLDRFGTLNKLYGEALGDQVILAAAVAFRKAFRDKDVLCRYGGDEFAFILPETGEDQALELCAGLRRELDLIDLLRERQGDLDRVTASIGLASARKGDTAETILARADAALYRVKDLGRDGAVAWRDRGPGSQKVALGSRMERLEVIDSILEKVLLGEHFLLLGHVHPDQDCVASLVAFALILLKLKKKPVVVLRPENKGHFSYLTDICRHNLIPVMDVETALSERYDTVMVFDTPKPEMLEYRRELEPFLGTGIPVIEFDHHIGADGHAIGDSGLRLVDEATSTCELITRFALRMNLRNGRDERLVFSDLFSRNFVLAVTTGILGDSRRGEFLRTDEQRWRYRSVSVLLDDLLKKKTAVGSGNLASLEEVLAALEESSEEESRCNQVFRDAVVSLPGLSYAVLTKKRSLRLFAQFGHDLVVSSAKFAADAFAEESGALGMVAFVDHPDRSPFVQFRLRRSRSYKDLDLRSVLADLAIENGGGHEGAVGFRFPAKQVRDPKVLAAELAEAIRGLMEGQTVETLFAQVGDAVQG